jgi:hypothetical protein
MSRSVNITLNTFQSIVRFSTLRERCRASRPFASMFGICR